MTTLRAAISAARDRLLSAAASEDEIEAEVEAEVLLRHALAPDGSATKAYLYARFEDEMATDVAQRFEVLLTRRLEHEPTAYITGHREFYGLDLRVTPDVLIPRPETELLVEKTIELSRRGPRRPRLRIADVGAGSGAIAVALAKTLPEAEVYAIDVSRAALAVAAENARRHGVERRLAFRRGHLLMPIYDYVDFIVANLPYVTTEDWLQLPPELREHEPRLALDGGEDGLDLIRSLLRQAPRYLAPKGAVLLEIGDGQLEPLRAFLASVWPEATCTAAPDLAGIPRVTMIG